MEEDKILNTNEAEETEKVTAAKETEQGNPQPKKPKTDWKKELKDWIISIGVALFVVFVLRTFLFQIIRVDGSSMFDTLENNERLFVTVLDVKLKGVDRNDVVICHYPNRGNTNFVKRIVAVPGDQVYRKGAITHVVYEENGETVDVELDNPYEYNSYYYCASLDDDYDVYTLGENEYFAVGDNRFNSHDSRDWNDHDDSNDVGPITKNMLVGKVRNVVWPLNRMRAVK